MNKLIKLLPSLFLISIYFIADEFFGPLIGTLCTLLLGIGEFLYTRLRYQTTDRLILITTLFFCLPGIISIWATGNLWEKLQSGIFETVVCILLGIFAFTRSDLTQTLPASYRQSIRLSPAQQQMMRNTIKTLFAILCLHTAAVYLSTFLCPPQTASFISGTLLYILLGAFFLCLILRNKWLNHRYTKEEWLPLVNEQGKITGQAPRKLCHSGSKLLHPVVHLHIINGQNDLFLQKRSMKKELLPGKWDTAVGGHISAGEKIEEALKRETREELGITTFEARLLGKYIWESNREKELVFSFLCTKYDRINIDNDEVDEGRFWSHQEIEKNSGKDIFTPNFEYEYQLLLKNIPKTC
nr:NUDIX domain-containing protein [Odoribacter lunatus]